MCNRKFLVKNYLIKKGFGIYCSRKCQFFDYPDRISKKCLQCARSFDVWPAKSTSAKFCSKKCADENLRDYVQRVCKNCKKIFMIPRSDTNRGRGTFCGRECYFKYNGETSIEEKTRLALEKANIGFQQEARIGFYNVDFLLTKTGAVIECDGEYWHASNKARVRDKRKNKYLQKLGYKVIRFPETYIRNSTLETITRRISESLHG